MANRCGLSPSTIRNLEQGDVALGRGDSYVAIRRVVEENGLEFTEFDGIRARPRGVRVFDGPQAIECFWEHVSKTAGEFGGDILVICPTLGMLLDCFGVTASRLGSIESLSDIAPIKCLLSDSEVAPTVGEAVQFRAVSGLQAWPAPYFMYGDRVCFSVWDGGGSLRFIAIQSSSQATAWSSHFLKLWDAAPLLKQRGVEQARRRCK
jgi:hypothetical protein